MTISSRARAAVLALAMVAARDGVAHANDGLAPAIEEGSGGRARGPQPWQVSAGVRSALFRSAGYDPFSTNDVFTQFAATATWAARTSASLASALGVAWESGGAQAQARGADTDLSLSRLGLALEERFAPRPWAYAFLRVCPGWLRGTASLKDPTIAAPLRTTFATLSVDASLGAAVRLNPRVSPVGVWLVGDAGYGWAPAQHLALAPALTAADRNKAGVTTLADLAPRGVFFRFALALAF
jgi:hypothetical protein